MTALTSQKQSTQQVVKSKKESAENPKPPPVPESKPHNQSQVKKMSRRSSKPIITWFQRKWSGTVRARRASETDSIRAQRLGARSPNAKEKQRRSSVPLPPILTAPRLKSKGAGSSKRNTISLNTFDDQASNTDGHAADSDDGQRSSLARDSTWSPISNYEADEDASVRPLPPSSPPSPSPSQSTSSYLSDPRTFRSMTASTKPTTVLSLDLTGGMAHIAQAPPTPTIPGHRLPLHIRTHSTGPGSGGSITFSAIPPSSPTTPSRPSSGGSVPRGAHLSLQAPQHTTHHPRNNPRPSSPPQDDASVLTLASSAFAMPSARYAAALALSGRASLADDSISHFSHAAGHGDSTSHFLLGEMDDERERYQDPDQDVDASVRALRPRSSRRGSWESEASGWSASASLALTGTAGGQSQGGTRSLWTAGSYRTGGVSVYNEDREDEEPSEDNHTHENGKYSSEDTSTSLSPSVAAENTSSTATSSSKAEDLRTPPVPVPESDAEADSPMAPSFESQVDGSLTSHRSVMETPKLASVPLEGSVVESSLLTTPAGETGDTTTTAERK
ncbi:hypothetical protein BKA93DRAFT_772192 [Sparassis latifolia]